MGGPVEILWGRMLDRIPTNWGESDDEWWGCPFNVALAFECKSDVETLASALNVTAMGGSRDSK